MPRAEWRPDAGLVDAKKVLWGFAMRTYLPCVVDRPAIVFWEPEPWRALPGYGWVFPGTDGVNVGFGLGMVGDRRAGATVNQMLPRFFEHLRELGLLDGAPDSTLPRPLGGWLKMGMVGTSPAAGRVLLVGDAAGLVNPLQGEGIAQALCSGRRAAEAVLGDPGRAADHVSVFPGCRPSPVSPHHRRGPGLVRRPTPSRGDGRPAAHDARKQRPAVRGLVRLLERVARRCARQWPPGGGRHGDPARTGGDGPLGDRTLVRRPAFRTMPVTTNLPWGSPDRLLTRIRVADLAEPAALALAGAIGHGLALEVGQPDHEDRDGRPSRRTRTRWRWRAVPSVVRRRKDWFRLGRNSL